MRLPMRRNCEELFWLQVLSCSQAESTPAHCTPMEHNETVRYFNEIQTNEIVSLKRRPDIQLDYEERK
jgi:hypothetical protein